MKLVEQVARHPAAVLIVGETGTGKEMIARSIHNCSLRCNNPWVDVNCAAIPEHLVESELFGYEKGAFSGADTMKPGLFEMADKGTLFLDEIGDLDLKVQVKLLRVLDGISYYRLGGSKKVGVDVRVVAATNQDLEQMLGTSRFRTDLYHRLGQIALRVPPLRERPEDILPLADHFLQKTRPGAFLSDGARLRLREHAWPGNIRELRNVITKTSIMSVSDEIGADGLALELERRPLAAGWAAVEALDIASHKPEPREVSGDETANLEGMERRTITKVLRQTNGHQQRAAELLGISRRTLSRKLKIYEMEIVRRSCAS